MTAPVLVKRLGDGGAGMDESHGSPSRLYEMMLALVKAGVPLIGRQAGTITATVKNAIIAPFDGVLGDLMVVVGTCGTAGSTVVKVNKNGVALATFITVAHDADDGTAAETDLSSDPEAAFSKGDVISIEVTTAPTAGADLEANVTLRPASIQD